jgi:hypothetical protein
VVLEVLVVAQQVVVWVEQVDVETLLQLVHLKETMEEQVLLVVQTQMVEEEEVQEQQALTLQVLHQVVVVMEYQQKLQVQQ